MDFKLGAKTAFAFDKGASGAARHLFIDTKGSRSSENGYRLEGSNLVKQLISLGKTHKDYSGYKSNTILQKSNSKKADNFQLYHLKPNFIFDVFFGENKENAVKVLNELKSLQEDVVQPMFIASENSTSPSIGFIGSSIFFVKGPKGTTFKLIDFAHPVLWNPTNLGGELSKNIKKAPDFKTHREVVQNYLEGINSLIRNLEAWIQRPKYAPSIFSVESNKTKKIASFEFQFDVTEFTKKKPGRKSNKQENAGAGKKKTRKYKKTSKNSNTRKNKK